MVQSYKAGRRYVAGAVIFLLLMLAADAVAMASGGRTLLGAVREYAQRTASPMWAMALGCTWGIGMVVLTGYGPVSPVHELQARRKRLRYGQGKTLEQLGEESRAAGESPRALRKRVEELTASRLKSSNPYLDAVEPAQHITAEDVVEADRRQVNWMAGGIALWGTWAALLLDVCGFLLFRTTLAETAFGRFGPGCLISACVSGGLAHFVGWGPHYAELEGGDV